ncbi:MAG: type II toxin-antitoxin system HipA family toxin [Gemmatimonadaceae bacterium]
MTRTPISTPGATALIALLNGVRVGHVSQTPSGTFRFAYYESWRNEEYAYPLSLSLPLSAVEHGHAATAAFLWGLLPDNARTLQRYGRLFGVAAGNPVALLSHLGRDCAGAVQFARPDAIAELEQPSRSKHVEWLSDEDVASELRSVRETGMPTNSKGAFGQFSLAGAQPKIALLEEGGRWGKPSGRTPSNRILKPPSGELHGFVENEHFCLELANALELGAVSSEVRRFADEIAIVVRRFDRVKRGRVYERVHQEDFCQARGVLPTRKYQSEGGPGITEVITMLREDSLRADEDIERFLRATALNWVIAATDAHAKNYALLHGTGGVRLAPFYDVLSYLPYADNALHRVNLAMSIGGEYGVRRVNRTRWERLAKENGMSATYVLDNVDEVLTRLPTALKSVTQATLETGLDRKAIRGLAARIRERTRECRAMLSSGTST